MPERFYEQDPNTGQRYYTEKGWSEWKPVPVEKDPNTGEEYELWHESWVPRKGAKPVDAFAESPAEMPSLSQGGMVVAGSENVAEDRIRKWAQKDPEAIGILSRKQEKEDTLEDRVKLGLVIRGEKPTNRRVANAVSYALSQQREQEQLKSGQEMADVKYRQALKEGTVSRVANLFMAGKPGFAAEGDPITTGYAVAGLSKGAKTIVDSVATLHDWAMSKAEGLGVISPSTHNMLTWAKNENVKGLTGPLMRATSVASPTRVVGAMADRDWEKALVSVPEEIFSQIPIVGATAPFAMEATGAKAGQAV